MNAIFADKNVAPTAPLDVRRSPGRLTTDRRQRVLLADDHKIIRELMVTLLATQPDLEVIGEACDGVEAVDLAARLHPDVILMDVSMPQMDGIAATRRIKRQMPQVRVIGFSTYDEMEIAARMREAGAEAFLSKGGPTDVLLAALRGRPFASPASVK
jgi:DNA-binding NarL/FixJ family response regulator